MTVFAISGSGIGAGKTYFAERLNTNYTVSLAQPIRDDLAGMYPGYPWASKSQTDKNIICSATGQTLRQMMVEYGQGKCKDDPCYFPKRLVEKIMEHPTASFAIDDLRKMCELTYLRDVFGEDLVHFHLIYPQAKAEPIYDAEELMVACDYLVTR